MERQSKKEELIELLRQGKEKWNAKRPQYDETSNEEIDLTFASLLLANLEGCDLSNCNLSNSVLSRANLSNTNLSNSILQNANLSKANLHKAKLISTNLTGANCRHADFSHAEFIDAIISQANFEGANFQNAKFESIRSANVSFKNANLTNSTFDNILLSGANYNTANLTRAKILNSRIERSYFSNTIFTEFTAPNTVFFGSRGAINQYLSGDLDIAVSAASSDDTKHLPRTNPMVDIASGTLIESIGAMPGILYQRSLRVPRRNITKHSQEKSIIDQKIKDTIAVWYGTNRKPVYAKGGQLKSYSSEKSDSIHYGVSAVEIKKSHRMGKINRPKWLKILSLDQSDYVNLKSYYSLSENEYWQTLQEHTNNARGLEKDILVVIHGYNVTFKDAIRRTAQIGKDIQFPGTLCCFSWPSKGREISYTADSTSIKASAEYIQDFLVQTVSNTGARKVNLLVHSMGNQGVLEALTRMSLASQKLQLGQIILAAPDVDSKHFYKESSVFDRYSMNTTLYVSNSDIAVWISKLLNEDTRAGYAPPIMIAPPLETIFVSDIDAGMLGHSYYANAKDILSDIKYIVSQNLKADSRFNLYRIPEEDHWYWKFGQ